MVIEPNKEHVTLYHGQGISQQVQTYKSKFEERGIVFTTIEIDLPHFDLRLATNSGNYQGINVRKHLDTALKHDDLSRFL
ncbi:MAG: hypothetical protein AABW46_02540 [Nanoarchaeota archaeon]